MFKWLLSVLVLLVVALSAVSPKKLSAQPDFNIPSELQREGRIHAKINKVVFAPINIRMLFNTDKSRYAQELLYFFYKKGFNSSPASDVIFENGEIYNLNPDWFITQFDNTLNTGVLMILLAYENDFQIDTFAPSIKKWLDASFVEALPYTSISAKESFMLKNFVIEPLVSPKVRFIDSDTYKLDPDMFAYLDYSNKILPTLDLVKLDSPIQVNPNELFTVKVAIKNNSKKEFIMGGGNYLQFRFSKDSSFYINNKWVNRRTPLASKQGFLKPQEEKVFELELMSPLVPGSVSEELIVLNKDKEFFKDKISIQVNDVGQKVLVIKMYTFDVLTIKKEPYSSSEEVGRTGEGQKYLFTETRNGYHKIKFGNKEGWVESRFVQVLTKN